MSLRGLLCSDERLCSEGILFFALMRDFALSEGILSLTGYFSLARFFTWKEDFCSEGKKGEGIERRPLGHVGSIHMQRYVHNEIGRQTTFHR